MAPLQFGILMIPYQVLDVALPTDILSSCSTDYFAILSKVNHPDAHLAPGAIDIEFHHINSTLSPVLLTSNTRSLPSTTLTTCPPLDYLLIGGPDLTTFTLSPEFSAFIKAHVDAGKGLFCTCTGALAIASSGVLDGRRATVNHEALEMAAQIRPQVKWERKRWVVDGNVWTSGGACAGGDMMAEWVVGKYGKEVAQVGFRGLDFEPRDVEGKRVVL
ncbi:hypothetical protein EG329_002446 [Mollisiaceae sp. DMI_Dod_QoI]|nr:hypothetical protein EG329_002446 [Helotiales sp. DMI_Dod_QoI]